MKCQHCGTGMKSTRGVHRYAESGLSNVTLINVETRVCPKCGERALVLPKIEELHRLIAQAVSQSQTKLGPEEIRFLRKWLGFSAADFALIMGVRPETVSRWESVEKPYQMAIPAERLLRLMVANQEPATQYPLDLFKLQPRVKPEPLRIKFAEGWKRAVS